MSQELFTLANFTHSLQYFAGNITFTALTKKLASPNIHVGLAVGDEIFVAGSVSNNGIKTIVTVGTNEITVAETVTDEGAVACTVNEQSSTKFLRVEWYGLIVGTLYASQNANLYVEWSHDGSITAITDTTALVGGVAAKIEDRMIVTPYVKITLRNNGTDQTLVATHLYAKCWD